MYAYCIMVSVWVSMNGTMLIGRPQSAISCSYCESMSSASPGSANWWTPNEEKPIRWRDWSQQWSGMFYTSCCVLGYMFWLEKFLWSILIVYACIISHLCAHASLYALWLCTCPSCAPWLFSCSLRECYPVYSTEICSATLVHQTQLFGVHASLQ